MKFRNIITPVIAGAVILLAAACSGSRTHDLAKANSRDLRQMNEDLDELRSSLIEARDSLIELQQWDGKKSKPFEDFTRKTARLIPLIERFGKQAGQLANSHATLLREWEKSLDQIETPALHAVAETQKTRTFKVYQELPGLAESLSNTLFNLKKEYTDLQRLYSLTLSEETLTATTDMVSLTAIRSTEVLSSIDHFMEQAGIAIADLENVSGQGSQKGHKLQEKSSAPISPDDNTALPKKERSPDHSRENTSSGPEEETPNTSQALPPSPPSHMGTSLPKLPDASEGINEKEAVQASSEQSSAKEETSSAQHISTDSQKEEIQN